MQSMGTYTTNYSDVLLLIYADLYKNDHDANISISLLYITKHLPVMLNYKRGSFRWLKHSGKLQDIAFNDKCLPHVQKKINTVVFPISVMRVDLNEKNIQYQSPSKVC